MPAPKHRLVDTYKDILTRSRQMLEMAKKGQWEELLVLQSAFMTNLGVLTYIHDNQILEDSDRPEAMELLGLILENWAEIKQKLTARRDELGHLIESAQYQEAHGGLGQVIRTDTYSRQDLYRNKAR